MGIGEQLDVGEPDCVLAFDSQLEHQPVGKVDEILVEYGKAAEDRRLSVVDTVHIGARIVDAVRVFPFRAAPRAQISVAGRGERLAKPLLVRIEAFVGERPGVHHTSLRRAD